MAIGDRILTSGFGSVYPQGLVIGTVCEIRSDDYTRQQIAILTPAVDFDRLSRVMIVTDCTITPVDPDAATENMPAEGEGGEPNVG